MIDNVNESWVGINEAAAHQMNWFRPDYPYAAVTCPPELTAEVTHRRDGDCVFTTITLHNKGKKPFFTHIGDIAVSFPLEDRYEDSATCLKHRCHTHIFCGGDVSYILALRMGGEAPHLGMVLTEGSLAAYSIDRNVKQRSNDRGCFLLHPAPMEFDAGETKTISWTIFPHIGKEDFLAKLPLFARFIHVEADRYVLYKGETCQVRIAPSFSADTVMVNGAAIPGENGTYSVSVKAEQCGEITLDIFVDDVHTYCRLFVHENLETLAAQRCRFIAEKQQYHGSVQSLQGAFLSYDNEEGTFDYTPKNDHNGGRERVCMGNLLARYLTMDNVENRSLLEKSLQDYLAYVLRELVEAETGNVCNDIGYDDSYKRLYNLPWYATFFCELFRLYQKNEYLSIACRIVRRFYQEGGNHFYPIEMPVLMLVRLLHSAGMDAEADEMQSWFVRHGDQMIGTDLNYPAHELNFEQSIVAPAVNFLLQVYCLTGEEKYLKAGKRQMNVLELFNGIQPDYHLNETSIRHWDGYWFGKRAMWGDTFPHYWSALTGNAFALYGELTGNKDYLHRAENSRRGVLPLIFPDGKASCAYVFPYSVNGVRGGFFDPFANDQDWGLYFALRAAQEEHELKTDEVR